MTPGTHTIDQFRDHAESVSAASPTLPSSLSLPTRAETTKAMNRLKLSMYIEQVDGNNFDIVNNASQIENWVASHTLEVQVLLNTIGNLNLREDDIMGANTVGAINDLLGIDLPVVSATVSATAVTPSVAGEASIPLPDFLADEVQARAVIEALGIEGVRIENGQLIGINELNTQEKLRKLSEYLDYTNYISSREITSSGLMTRYKELLDYPTDFIIDKKYLVMQYASAIYSEIIKAGYIVRQSRNNGVRGEYNITNRETNEVILDSDFQDFVSDPFIRTEYIEFARLNSIVGSPNSYWNERMITRQGLVEHILENNMIIRDELGGIQSVEALLLNKVKVVGQLKMRADDLSTGPERNSKEYEELVWLLDFLEHDQYEQENIQVNLFDNINHYNKVFLQENALIDALTAEGIDPNSTELNDDIMSRIERVLGKNSPALYLLGIVMILFGDTRKWGVGIILGTMAAKIGINIASDATDAAGFTDSGGIRGDAFDIFDPIDLKHRIKYPEGFDRTNYDPTLTGLYELNNTRRSDGEIINGVAVQHTTNAKIALIFQETLNNDVLLSTEYASADTNMLAQAIFDGMGTHEINENSFDSRVPLEQREEVSLTDVKIFLNLLREKENSGDTTIGDLLYANKLDKLNHDYNSSGYNFTESGDIVDPLIHDVFRTAWNDTTATRETRADMLEMLNYFDSYLYSGLGDTIQNVWSMSGAGAALTGPSLGDKINKIGDLKNLLNSSNLDQRMKMALRSVLLKYEELLQKEDKFESIRGSWYDVSAGSRIRFLNLSSWLRGQEQNETSLELLKTNVATDIGRLEALLGTLPSHTMYNNLRVEVENEINYLKITENQIIDAIISNSDISSIIDNAGGARKDINDSVELGVITGVATNIHGSLRGSISASIENSLFGASESDIRAAIEDGYQKILDGGVNGLNSGASITVNTWNNFRGAIQNALAIKLNGTMVSDVIGNISFIGTLPAADTVIVNNVFNRATIDQITAQIQLRILERYFANNEVYLDNLKKLHDAYIPELDNIISGGGSLTPEQQDLYDLISINSSNTTTSDYERLLIDIENKVKNLADSYEGSQKMTLISGLLTNTLDAITSGNLDEFLEISQFLQSNKVDNTQVTFLQTQINRHFGTPNSLDGILVSTTNLSSAFEGQKNLLKTYIEGLDITNSSTGGYIEQMNTFIDVKNALDSLEKVQEILGGIGNSTDIDTAIIALRARRLEVATVNEIPEIREAIDNDINTLTTDISTLNGNSSRTPSQNNILAEKTELRDLLIRSKGNSMGISALKINLEAYNPAPPSGEPRLFNQAYYAETVSALSL